MLAIEPKVPGSNPAEDDVFLMATKIRIKNFFGGK
jgi:hypothetical protein